MSALPIVEIQRGNLSAYIPTNLISITDGQIVLDNDMFNQGIKPAVEVGRSVSRVGGAAQTDAMKEVASEIRLELAQYEEVSQFARFGTDLDEATQRQISRGRRLQTVLTQPVNRPLSLGEQVIVLFAATQGYLDELVSDKYQESEEALLAYFNEHHPNIIPQIERHEELTDELKDDLKKFMDEYFANE
jgi:F-type H+-transporting ATPase subunit alpha